MHSPKGKFSLKKRIVKKGIHKTEAQKIIARIRPVIREEVERLRFKKGLTVKELREWFEYQKSLARKGEHVAALELERKRFEKTIARENKGKTVSKRRVAPFNEKNEFNQMFKMMEGLSHLYNSLFSSLTTEGNRHACNLLKNLWDPFNADVREKALARLLRNRKKAYFKQFLPCVIPLLFDEKPITRWHAIKALRGNKVIAGIDLLGIFARMADSDPSKLVRKAAFKAFKESW
jgi:hypothetical protein